MLKVAFVVQRYGLEVNGGSELCCRRTAEQMSKYWDIEVITTCAVDYMTWKNEYALGKDDINGILVQRFTVDKERNIKKFNQLSRKLYGNNNNREDEIQWMKLQGPYSTPLFNYIEDKKNHFDFFIFFTYLYCTTFFGLPIVKEKAVLVPTAHDEPPIYFKIFDELFKMPAGFIYLTHQEKTFLAKRFNYDGTGEVTGMGIDVPDVIDSDNFRKKYHVNDDFLLYMGRIDLSKGCGELFDFFERYRKDFKSNIKLVLTGHPQMKIPRSKGIVHLGFIPEQDKFGALGAARLLVIPSPYESLSIVTLEAFITKTPVLANGKCLVLKDQCKNSNAGLYYTNYDEFAECLNLLLNNEEISKKMGTNGKAYVEKNYDWRNIENKYINTLENIS